VLAVAARLGGAGLLGLKGPEVLVAAVVVILENCLKQVICRQLYL
jgi:hypothetical protein